MVHLIERPARLAVALSLAAALAACGSSQQETALSATDALASVGTVELTLEALADQRVTSTYARVAVQEAATELSTARSALDLVAPATPDEAAVQQQIAAAMNDAVAAVGDAQQTLDGLPGAPTLDEALAGVGDAAAALEEAGAGAGSPR